MPAAIVILALLLLTAPLCGCGVLKLQGPFANDPLTGGLDTSTSQLLGISLPAGMQAYRSHGFTQPDASGPAGLEVLRGSCSMQEAAQALHNSLVPLGWQLRWHMGKGKRLVQIYDNGQEMVVLQYKPQGSMTILELWRGPRLADGAELPSSLSLAPIAPPADDETFMEDSLPELPGESYPPLTDATDGSAGRSTGISPDISAPSASRPRVGDVETWGDAPLEREL
ncbi:MAG: hypothetical protein IJA79_07655 [Desulfovibrio sp.]|nr:hypothetical protein [Desulfovibrio sp.]